MWFAALMIVAFLLQPALPDTMQNTASADTTYTNPNGSSELSKLMREMEAFTKSAKTDVSTGKNPALYPVTFNKIYTAALSEGSHKSDFYNAFADLYLASVKNYSASNSSNRVETYNNMVSACLACHSQHCPGPVPAIKKLSLDSGK